MTSLLPLLRRTLTAFFLALTVLASFGVEAGAQEAVQDPSSDAIAQFNSGQDAHARGELATAADLYRKALAVVAAFPEAEYQLGSALRSLGKYDEAESAFRRAVGLRPDWTLAIAALGDTLVTNRKFDEAETVLDQAIKLDDLNFPAFAALTELRLRTNTSSTKLRELLTRLTDLTSKSNPPASIWTAKAAVERALGDLHAARASISSALSIEPSNHSALRESVNISLSSSDPASAEAYVKRLEAAAPNAVSTKALRARVLVAQGKPDEALSRLASIDGDNEEVDALRKSITLSSSTDRSVLEGSLATNPSDVVALARLCSILRVPDPAKAVEYCSRASLLEPSNLDHLIGFGSALIQAKRFAEATDVFQKLITRAPDNSTVHANLATALFFQARYGDAKAEYKWLTEHQPEVAAGFYFLGLTHDKLGEYLDAFANYQQFLKIANTDTNQIEIEKVNLRIPALQKLIKDGKGKRSK